MPKMKTQRSAAKRFKVTATGKLLHRRGFRSHLLEGKPTKRTRRLGKAVEVQGGMRKKVKKILGG